jgi:hypothetical protein
MQPLFIAKRPFDPTVGTGWDRYVAWSGLHQLREVVSLDTILCPTVPEQLTATDWDYNVHADYQVFFFRTLEYLQQRVSNERCRPRCAGNTPSRLTRSAMSGRSGDNAVRLK